MALQRGFGTDLLAIEVDRVHAARYLLLERPEVGRVTVFGDRLHVTVPIGAERLAVNMLRDAGLRVGVAERVPPTLEDVFIDRIASAEAA
jgi:hypothetical protein